MDGSAIIVDYNTKGLTINCLLSVFRQIKELEICKVVIGWRAIAIFDNRLSIL